MLDPVDRVRHTHAILVKRRRGRFVWLVLHECDEARIGNVRVRTRLLHLADASVLLGEVVDVLHLPDERQRNAVEQLHDHLLLRHHQRRSFFTSSVSDMASRRSMRKLIVGLPKKKQ